MRARLVSNVVVLAIMLILFFAACFIEDLTYLQTLEAIALLNITGAVFTIANKE
jgi:hypothetical protein